MFSHMQALLLVCTKHARSNPSLVLTIITQSWKWMPALNSVLLYYFELWH